MGCSLWFGRRPAVVVVALVAVLSAACGGGGSSSNTPTPAQTNEPSRVDQPAPPPVAISPVPQNVGLSDPTFTALPGARAEYGHLGGTVYQIEVPDNWNGRLVMWMHGFQNLAPNASTGPPPIRTYLVRHGYAWAASSFSSTVLIPGRAADETAALWDLFVKEYRRPDWTYITGASMGGAATNIAAERYPDRFDGALGLCGYAGQTATVQTDADFFFVGAYLAGVTQAEFDQGDTANLIYQKIVPALTDPDLHRKFVDLMTALTGGPRPFEDQGFALEEATNWFRDSILVPYHVAYNRDENGDYQYSFPTTDGITADDFNRNVVRSPRSDQAVADFNAGNEISGDIKMPLLTLHTTGDWQVPVNQEQILADKVEAAGRSDLLVERAVQAPGHCGFTAGEYVTALDDLVQWVEHGLKPAGENLRVPDLGNAGAEFTQAPRLGSPSADNVAGADQRLTLTGQMTVDGQPVSGDGAMTIAVVRDGALAEVCGFLVDTPVTGSYTMGVAADAEQPGCGKSGRSLYMVRLQHGWHDSREVDWPPGTQLAYNPEFSSSDRPPGVTVLFGMLLDASGNLMPPGTIVEAYVGDTLCGRAASPQVVNPLSQPGGYGMLVVGPDAAPACAAGGSITFRVNGQAASSVRTVTNRLDNNWRQVDLWLQP